MTITSQNKKQSKHFHYPAGRVVVRAILAGLFFTGVSVHAAVVSVSPHEVGGSGTTDIDVRIDTEGAVINALEMTVTLPENMVTLREVHEGKSVVSFWTQPARIENNTVTLAGIIPGGFQGQGVVTTLRVSGVRGGEASIRVSDISVLLNDGEGTSVATRIGDVSLSIISSAESVVPVADTIAPEPFTVWVTKDESIGGGAYVAIFATQDKQTGIARYDIQETDAYVPDENSWVLATSPFVLSDQTLNSNIFVRATDYAGNTRIAEYETERGISLLEGALYLMVSLVVVLLLFAFYVRHAHRKKVGLSNV